MRGRWWGGALAVALVVLLAAAVPSTAAPSPGVGARDPLRVTTVNLIDTLDPGAITPPIQGRPALECVSGQPHRPNPNYYSRLPRELRPFHQRVTLGGGGAGRVELRDALLFQAPRSFVWEVVPDGQPRLEFAYHTFACGGGDRGGVRLVITADDGDGVVVRRVALKPVPPGEGTRWGEVVVDLPLAAGRPVRLELAFEATRPGTAVAWAQPVLTGVPGVALGTPPEPPGRDANVLLIIVDALRGDVIGSGRRSDLPSVSRHFDTLFADGTSFTRAYAVANQTRPSTLGLLASQAPSIGGFHSRGWTLTDKKKGAFYASDPPLLTNLLGRAGWTVAHIGQNHFLWEGQDIGFDHGFDRQIDFRAVPEDTPAMTAEAVRFIGEHADRRWFLTLNYTAPHTPYAAPEPFASEVEERLGDKPKDGVSRKYLAELAYVDDAVQHVFAALEAAGLDDRTLVVLTADHGEVMHTAHACFSAKLEMPCEYNHGLTMYAEETHVPWAWRWPGRVAAGHVVTTPVSQTDFAPTVLALLGLPAAPRQTGVSLGGALAGGGTAQRGIYSEGRYSSAVQVGDLRLIVHSREDDVHTRARIGRRPTGVDPLYELFDLAVDPDETDNLALGDDSRLEGMLDELDAVRRDQRARAAAAPASGSLAGAPAVEAAAVEDLGPVAFNSLRLEGDAALHTLEGLVTVDEGAVVMCTAADANASCRQAGRRAVVVALAAREGEPALAGFATAPWAAPVGLTLVLDGRPLAADRVRLGAYGLRLLAAGETLDRPGRLRLAVAERPPQTEGDALGVYLWRDPPHAPRVAAAPDAEGEGGDGDAHMNEEVRSVLRSLGYTR